MTSQIPPTGGRSECLKRMIAVTMSESRDHNAQRVFVLGFLTSAAVPGTCAVSEAMVVDFGVARQRLRLRGAKLLKVLFNKERSMY